MDPNEYWPGTTVRVSMTFRDAQQALIDPATRVRFSVKDPSKIVTIYEYITNPEIIRVSTGLYTVDVAALLSGTYHLRGFGDTGTATTASESSFIVKQGQFAA